MISTAILGSASFWAAVLQGCIVTVSLTILSMALGFVLGTALACGRVYGSPSVRYLTQSYVFVFRGIPLLILLFLVYYGLPRLESLRTGIFWDLVLSSSYRTALFVLSINNAAYLAEIVRGGLVMVPSGAVEAGRAIGMTSLRVFARIQAPIAIRSILGNLGSETIAVMKASAITSVITVHDLMGGPTVIGKVYLDPFTPLIVVGFVYVLFVQGIDMAVGGVRKFLSIPGTLASGH